MRRKPSSKRQTRRSHFQLKTAKIPRLIKRPRLGRFPECQLPCLKQPHNLNAAIKTSLNPVHDTVAPASLAILARAQPHQEAAQKLEHLSGQEAACARLIVCLRCCSGLNYMLCKTDASSRGSDHRAKGAWFGSAELSPTMGLTGQIGSAFECSRWSPG